MILNEKINAFAAEMEAVCRKNDAISPELYSRLGVKKG